MVPLGVPMLKTLGRWGASSDFLLVYIEETRTMTQNTAQTAGPVARRTEAAEPVILPAVPVTTTPFQPDKVRHLVFGTLSALQDTIKDLHCRGYAEPNDWSQPLPTGRPAEVMAILTKRVEPPQAG